MEDKSTIYITVAPGPTPEDKLILHAVEHHIEKEAVTEVTQLARVFQSRSSPSTTVCRQCRWCSGSQSS